MEITTDLGGPLIRVFRDEEAESAFKSAYKAWEGAMGADFKTREVLWAVYCRARDEWLFKEFRELSVYQSS